MPAERVSASGKNLRISAAGQLLTVILNLIMRRMFIGLLGAEYTGFSGLCGHVLNFLALLEPGFDAACIYCLYRPLAYNDRASVCAVMTYIKKVYRIIGILTLLLGLLAMPAVFAFSHKTVDTGFAAAVYLIMLLEMSFSYFLSHRAILPIADQKNYVNSLYGCISFTVSRLIQLAVLGRTGNVILYLAAGLVLGILGEIILSVKIGKMYPYIKKNSPPISRELKKEVNANASSLFFRKAGAVLCGSVDNMAVFVFLGLSGGAVYSNYTMLSGICLTFISVIISSASSSVGNLGVTDGKRRMHGIYSTAMFAICLVSGIFAISLFFTYPLIVTLWLGKDMVLDTPTTALFCICMFVSAIRRPTCVFIDALGLFEKERFKALIEAAIMIAATLIFTPGFGICGVLMGQLCASLLFSLPCEAYILFRHGFGKSTGLYFLELLKYVLAVLMSLVLSLALCLCTNSIVPGIPLILARLLICTLSTLCVFFILFFDSTRLSETLRYAKKMLAAKI